MSISAVRSCMLHASYRPTRCERLHEKILRYRICNTNNPLKSADHEARKDMSNTESVTSNSDEDEIVSLITDMYKLLLQLGHMKEEDIIWAPPEGHDLDTSKLDPSIQIDDRVLSLMMRLPAPQIPWPRFAVCDEMRAIDYRHANYLTRSRDIDKVGGNKQFWTPDQSNCRSTDMLPFDQMGSQCSKLALCTAESKSVEACECGDLHAITDVVRVVEIGHSNEEYFKNYDAARERGNTGPDYLHFPAQDVFSYFARELDCLLTGKTIPDFVGGFSNASYSVRAGEQHSSHCTDELQDVAKDVQHKLINVYKWPGSDFRKDDWFKDGPAIVDTIQQDWERRQRLAIAGAFPKSETQLADNTHA